jgi:branched-subunit amino acid transport protein
MAARGDGTFDRAYLFGHTFVQYVGWVAGTVVGVVVPSLDARALGLDAVFPPSSWRCSWARSRTACERAWPSAVPSSPSPWSPSPRPASRCWSRRRGAGRSAAACVSTTTVWVVVALCAVATAVTKGLGPALTGSRELPSPALRVVALLGAALVSALVVTNALADGDRIAVGADTAGVVVAGVLLWRRASLVLAVVAAAAVTAGLRAAGVG